MESITEAEYIAKYGDPRRDIDDEMMAKSPPDDVDLTTDEKLDQLLTLLRPLGPFLADLPEMMAKISPLIEGAKKSPVLRMMGISL